MTRVLQPANPTQPPVLPGTQVVTQIPMNTAINAGDYVYLTANGYGVAASSPALGAITVPWNGSTATGYLQTSGSVAGYQYGPVATQGTYSGTTYTLGQVALSPTVINSSSMSSTNSGLTALTNGNFVYVYRTGSNSYSFQIISPSGSVVAGPTAMPSALYDGSVQRFGIAPLASGGFIICYSSTGGTGLFVQKYTSAGVASGSLFNLPAGGYAATSYYFVNVIELVGGNFVFAYTYASSGYYTVTDSSYNIIQSHVGIDRYASYASNIPTTGYLGAIPMPFGGFLILWWDFSYGFRLGSYNSSGGWLLPNYALSPSVSYSSSYARSISICPTASGDLVVVGQNGGALLSYRYKFSSDYSNITNTYGPFTIDSTSGSSGTNTNVFACSNDTFGVFYINNSGYTYVSFTTSASTASSQVWGTPVALLGTTGVSQYTSTNPFIASPYGRAAWCINPASTSYYPNAVNVASFAATNGQTLNGVNYSPPNYFLQGVATNTVSSGQMANVVINGVATLNSNYPSLATPVNFDYSGLGQFGNSGYIVGRTVTLKGAE